MEENLKLLPGSAADKAAVAWAALTLSRLGIEFWGAEGPNAWDVLTDYGWIPCNSVREFVSVARSATLDAARVVRESRSCEI